MEYKRHENFLFLRLEKGEELFTTLAALCKKEQIRAGAVSGIGATDDVTVGLFDTTKNEYCSATYNGDMEITSISGNISEKDGESYFHLHITVADESNRVVGGHLSRCVISVTAEITIICFNIRTSRVPNEDGINLLHFPKA